MKTCIACGGIVHWGQVRNELDWVLEQADHYGVESLTEAQQSVYNGRVCSAACLGIAEDSGFNGVVKSMYKKKRC